MKTQFLLPKVYFGSFIPVAAILFLTCLLLGYPLPLVLMEVSTAAIISLPATIVLHAVCSLMSHYEITRVGAWILVFALIPVLAILPALLLARSIPGDVPVLIALGMLSGYSGIFSQAISINHHFNAFEYEAD